MISKTIFTAVSFLSLLASAATVADDMQSIEEMLDGEVIHALPNGEVVTLQYIKGKPLPQSTERIKFSGAGPMIRNASGDVSYKWGFTLDFIGPQAPINVKIESVSESQVETLVDEHVGIANAPKNGESWLGVSPRVCRIARDEACSAWVFEPQPHIFVFKATFLYIDGSSEEIYQSAVIDPSLFLSKLKL